MKEEQINIEVSKILKVKLGFDNPFHSFFNIFL